MELFGIEIEAEFYPAGTLSDVLKVEIQDLTSNWNDLENGNHPVKRLTSTAESYRNSLQLIRRTHNRDRQLELYHELHHKLLNALGYSYSPQTRLTALEGTKRIPLISSVSSAEEEKLWVLQAPLSENKDESSDPLSESFAEYQFPDDEVEVAETSLPIEGILANGIFSQKKSPQFVLILGLSQIVLVDKRKWASQSVLRFDLKEIFSRKNEDTLTVTACLISREARVPEQGISISERIEEEAQRSANAVTSSLKRTVRDAIEFLGQEVLDVTEGKYPSGDRKGVWIKGPDLSQECLRYMYRLLFLFYVEANKDLKILEKNNLAYMKGYSIEMLRELESVRLRTQEERDGTFLWDSLQKTLKLFFEGENTFLKIPAIKVSLLAPESTPLLNSIRLRNEAVQKIIRLLSLKSTKKSTSRISYAKLGIGQLGAVYETLISFTGVVAKTDLIQINPSKGKRLAVDQEDVDSEDENYLESEQEIDMEEPDSVVYSQEDQQIDNISMRNDTIDFLAPSYFVSRNRIDEFKPEDVVFQKNTALVYPKGSFIYRLAGRDREKSASYYTPEPLARLLVKHAIMELCSGLKADEILELKILEPAMGSAAFLVEATNQLADIYLERKQKETKQTITQAEYIKEKQKVRAFIADRNCFGVDLNPIAAELGAISLWLNGLHDSNFSPWFGDQLHTGNSLLGARRATYSPDTLSANRKNDLWLNKAPTEIGWKNQLPEGHIWQWLLPASGMLNYDKGNNIKSLVGEASLIISKWKSSEFFDKFQEHERKLLQKISRVADELYEQVAIDLSKTRATTNDEITLWPDIFMQGNKHLDFRNKTKLNEFVTGVEHATNTLPYKRLKTAMDAWCALWLWPIDKVEYLPTRSEFIQGMAMILEGGYREDGTLSASSIEEFPDPILELNFEKNNLQNFRNEDVYIKSELQIKETNVESLIDAFEWLKISSSVAKRERFTHFDLIFADVMKARKGFDLVLGNPPWARPGWNEAQFLPEVDPSFIGITAAKAKTELQKIIENQSLKLKLLSEVVSVRGAMELTSSKVMNPFLGGGANNLYRCFLDLSFRLTSPNGCASLIHQDRHLSDPKAGKLRSHWYKRIHKHFHFVNAFKQKNFREVGSAAEFSLNIYRGSEGEVNFDNFTNAVLPVQIEESYSHDGSGKIPAIKDDSGLKWNTNGHKKRIVRIAKDELGIITSLTSLKSKRGIESKFYQPMNTDILGVLEKISQIAKLGETDIIWQNSRMWDEANSQKERILEKKSGFCEKFEEVILNGAMLYIANPLYKTAKQKVSTKSDFDCIELINLPDDYIPRTNFKFHEQVNDIRNYIKNCNWNSLLSYIDNFRFAFRRMTARVNERTFIGAIIPTGASHIDSLNSVAFMDELNLLRAAAAWVSIPFDFLIKLSGKTNLDSSDLEVLPWLQLNQIALCHILRLSCITSSYTDIWQRNFQHITFQSWSSNDPRLPKQKLSDKWERKSAYRTDFERRMALVELDVLVAQELGLSLEDLIEIYMIYFPVMRQYEDNTWYDQKGQIVWTKSGGLKGVGYLDETGKKLGQAAWEKLLESNPPELTCTVEDDTLPGGPRKVEREFIGPFDKCDRIADYKRAWVHFEDLRSKGLL